ILPISALNTRYSHQKDREVKMQEIVNKVGIQSFANNGFPISTVFEVYPSCFDRPFAPGASPCIIKELTKTLEALEILDNMLESFLNIQVKSANLFILIKYG
ncbi:hypothetical protein scyTo_0016397, partial [Scyliorhinus torazame]|nr:hypothetical protein [Scyliorhinus torazame]